MSLAAVSSENTPQRNAGGKSPAEVREMFSRVSRRYDFLNHLLSMGLDIRWRNVAAREAKGLGEKDVIADLCTGTGDLAFAMHYAAPKARVLALDFTPEMVFYGPKKAARKNVNRIQFGIADALKVPIADSSVAIASVAFGIRNVSDLAGGLREMTRIIKPGGKVIILECTKPSGIIGPLYMFYFKNILPLIGRVIAATAGDAYKYLPQSVQAFAGPQEMSVKMKEAGLENIRAIPLTFGTVHLYVGQKPQERPQ